MDEQKVREYLVLLLLGTAKSRDHTMLKIQKEFFYLWKSSEHIQELIEFVAHYKGPYSDGLNDTIKSPSYLENYWVYKPPEKNDRISGGSVSLTEKGKEKFMEIVESVKEKNEMSQILASMHLLHDLYDRLSDKEMLLLVYSNPDNSPFIEKSEIYNEVVNETVKTNLYNKIKDSNPYIFDTEA